MSLVVASTVMIASGRNEASTPVFVIVSALSVPSSTSIAVVASDCCAPQPKRMMFVPAVGVVPTLKLPCRIASSNRSEVLSICVHSRPATKVLDEARFAKSNVIVVAEP
jgi:hypothetical protein